MKNISLEIVCSMDKIYSRLDIAEQLVNRKMDLRKLAQNIAQR